MDATVLRKYLQPSPTLRWHPWAPLAAGALLLLFAFFLGASWGWSASERQWRSMEGAYGGRVFVDYLGEEKWPGSRVLADAMAIDSVVYKYVRRESNPPTRWQRFVASLDGYTFNAYSVHLDRATVVRMAEFRLAELSPASPRWQATSRWCDRYAMPVQAVDILSAYSQAAADYSKLLGREVRAQELAPAVPGWKCEPTVLRRTQ